jgi:hypothetical protein
MTKNKVIKSVAFNANNEDDTKILEAVKDKNFSAYVKELILADLNAAKDDSQESSLLDIEYTGSLRLIRRNKRGGITILNPSSLSE